MQLDGFVNSHVINNFKKCQSLQIYADFSMYYHHRLAGWGQVSTSTWD
jgi:hypothetical protein